MYDVLNIFQAKVENDKKVTEPEIKQAEQTPMPKTEDTKLKPKQEEVKNQKKLLNRTKSPKFSSQDIKIEATEVAETKSDKTDHSQKEHEDTPSTTKPDDTQTQVDKPHPETEPVKSDDNEPTKTTEEIEQPKVDSQVN